MQDDRYGNYVINFITLARIVFYPAVSFFLPSIRRIGHDLTPLEGRIVVLKNALTMMIPWV